MLGNDSVDRTNHLVSGDRSIRGEQDAQTGAAVLDLPSLVVIGDINFAAIGCVHYSVPPSIPTAITDVSFAVLV